MKNNPFDVGFDTHKLELSMLFGMMNDKETFTYASQQLSDSSFQDSTNRKIFNSIKLQQKHPIDLAILFNEYSNEESVVDRIMQIGEEGISVVPTWAWMKSVLERLLIVQVKNELLQKLLVAQQSLIGDNFKSVLEVNLAVKGLVEQVRIGADLKNFIASPEVLASELENRGAEAMDKLDTKEDSFVMSGFTELDECLYGLRPGKLIVIAARPAIGKTSLALNIAENVAFNQKKTVLFVSYEMDRDELVDRIACVHLKKHVRFMVDRASWDRDTPTEILRVADMVRESCLHVGDRIYRDVDKLISLVQLQHATVGIDLLVIDYLQLMSSSTYGSKAMKVLEVSDITGKLKSLAQELKIPVILLSQLNREIEKRPNKRPNSSDLRDSGSIEQDADAVIFINRNKPGEEQKREPELSDKEARIIVDKVRDGLPRDIILGFNSEQTRFLNPISQKTTSVSS